ncbi:MAG TPA: FtsX-like permease family protein [Chryseolinea sp.]|nr:FtsX-like permease family protein [Chryseolinea sp.]
MIRNYLKVAFRSIFRNKLTAFINIAGLSLAMACAILIYLFVSDEVSYEKYHSKADRIYRVTRSFHSPEGEVNLHLANVAPPIGPLLKNDFGEIEILARTINYGIVVSLEENGQVKMSNEEPEVFLAEPNIFKIFDIEIKSGDAVKSLERPFTIMLSEKAAKRYFNDENIIGKRLRANNQLDLEVTGVYKNFPLQSHWHPEFLVSFVTLENDNIYGRKGLETNWGNNSFGTYFLLQEGADPKKLEASLPAFLDKHFGKYARANWGVPPDWKASSTTTLFVQKVTDIHLRSHLDDELEANGNITNVYMMSVIGLFIVLIACFNFINLSTARATKRAKEVGMRKVVGAYRTQLINQYLSESILTAGLALIFAVGIAFGALGSLNTFTNKQLSLDLIHNVPLGIGLILFALVIGTLAGIYPAFIISSFKPALTLKGQQGMTPGKSFLRKGLVVSQFSISIILIIATLVIFRQLDYLNSRSLGYDRNQVVTLPYYRELSANYDAFYNELTRSTAIKNVARSSRIPTGRLLDSYGSARVLKGDSLVEAQVDLKTIITDPEFFDTYSIAISQGRKFSKDILTDDSLAFIINEAAAKEIGWKNPEEYLDKEFLYADVKGKLIGIVKDFNFESLHQQIRPMIFWQRPNYNALSIKINSAAMKEGLAQLEKAWKSFLPARPFDYQFLSERYRSLYEAEQKQSQLFTAFAGLAIFIASLGLFGLATFNTLQRIKEIGIRKVLGASIPNILTLLSKEIIILIIAANVVAWPLAWYFMNKWLATFAYHIDMDVLVYILAAVVAILIALITVSAQTIKAAMSNPAKTLRYE